MMAEPGARRDWATETDGRGGGLPRTGHLWRRERTRSGLEPSIGMASSNIKSTGEIQYTY